MGKRLVYLKRANNDLVGNCNCEDGRVTYPPQMDCPWCGCGWLFTCITCRKGFTFAVGVELETTWEDLAKEDWTGWGIKRVSKKHIADWIATMKPMLAEVKPGKKYVCLDGRVIERTAKNVEFEGIYAAHKLEKLPHVEALKDRSIEEKVLANPEYWRSRKLKRKKKA